MSDFFVTRALKCQFRNMPLVRTKTLVLRTGFQGICSSRGTRPGKNGFAIPLALSLLFVLGLLAFFLLQYERNQDAKTFHVVNIEKSKVVGEAAIEAATYHMRGQMNNLRNLNPFSFIKDLISIFSSRDASWYARLRMPMLIMSAGTSAGTFIPGADLTLQVSPELLLPADWNKMTYNADSLPGLADVIKNMGGDPSKSKVECTVDIKEMKPIVSAEGHVLWPGLKMDESLHNYVNKLGTKLFDFLGVNDLKISIPIGSTVAKLFSDSLPTPMNTIASFFTKALTGALKGLDIEINVGELLNKVFASLTNLIHIPDIKPLTGNIVMEKMATLYYNCRVSFIPKGSSLPFVTEIEASRDIRVIDMMAANPLYSFYWLNDSKQKYSKNDWSYNHNGIFKLNNLSLDYGYNNGIRIPEDIVNFFKGIFTAQIVRYPGLCYFGGQDEIAVATGLNDLLLIYPKHTPIFRLMFSPFDTAKTYLPATLIPDFPIDGSILPSFLPSPSIGFYALGHIIVGAFTDLLKRPKIRLFGDWCIFPTIKLRIDGNVNKVYKRIRAVIFTVPVPFPPCTLKFGFYYYEDEKNGYTYSINEKPAQAQLNGSIENIYAPDQYKKKATLVYPAGADFNSDASIRDSKDVIRIDGVYYIDGDLTLEGDTKFFGAGQLVVKGNLTVKGSIMHLPLSNDSFDGTKVIHGNDGKLMPLVIICFKKATFSPGSEARIMAPVYAKEGVTTSGGGVHIMGNLVCNKFDPKQIGSDLTVWYTPEIAVCSFMGLLPQVGRFAPDRYRAILSNQYSTFKINKISN